MTDMTELVLVSFGFMDVDAWKNDPNLGAFSARDLMLKLGYKTVEEWSAAVMPLHREVERAEKAQTAEALMKFWYALGKVPDPNQFNVYFEAFRQTPPALLRKAVDRLIETRRFSNIPTVAEIKEGIQAVALNDYA